MNRVFCYSEGNMNFREWLDAELEKRGWSRRTAAKKAGLSDSIITKVINNRSDPGVNFIKGIAKALGVSQYEILGRINGIWPDNEGETSALRELAAQLEPDQRAELFEIGRLKLHLQEQRARYTTRIETRPEDQDEDPIVLMEKTIRRWASENGYQVEELELSEVEKPARLRSGSKSARLQKKPGNNRSS
jgi:transcriptional regulator with XRE-family HTH domain